MINFELNRKALMFIEQIKALKHDEINQKQKNPTKILSTLNPVEVNPADALVYGIEKSNMDIANKAFQYGATVKKAESILGKSPLFYKNITYTMMELLLEQGACPDVKNEANETLLEQVVKSGDVQKIELLLKQKVSFDCPWFIDYVKKSKNIDLLEIIYNSACYYDDHNNFSLVISLIQELELKEALIDSNLIKSLYKLVISILKANNYEEFEDIFSAGIESASTIIFGKPLLLLVVETCNNIDIVDLFLRKEGVLENYELLVEACKIAEAKNGDAVTSIYLTLEKALFHAVDRNDTSGVELLFSYGLSPFTVNSEGKSLLQVVLEKNDQELRAYVLQEAKRLHKKLLEAIASDDKKIIVELFRKGLPPDSMDDAGNPLLHIAIKKKDISLCQILLQFGASLELKDQEGCTAEQVATAINFDIFLDKIDQLRTLKEKRELEIIECEKSEQCKKVVHIVKDWKILSMKCQEKVFQESMLYQVFSDSALVCSIIARKHFTDSIRLLIVKDRALRQIQAVAAYRCFSDHIELEALVTNPQNIRAPMNANIISRVEGAASKIIDKLKDILQSDQSVTYISLENTSSSLSFYRKHEFVENLNDTSKLIFNKKK